MIHQVCTLYYSAYQRRPDDWGLTIDLRQWYEEGGGPADVQPLSQRRNAKIMVQAEKSKSLSNHPIISSYLPDLLCVSVCVCVVCMCVCVD